MFSGMARRRSSDGSSRRKSAPEARAERVTWALMVLVFAVVQLLSGSLPNSFVPFAGSVILLGSGFYQYSRRWRVSPVTWIGGALMAFFAYYSLSIDTARSFQGETLVIFFIVIVFGLITGET
jgi:carbon starvation protein CstA